jgi:hypothetical protein
MLRTIFWIKVCVPNTVSNTLMMIIFYLPVWLNFCGISMLCVFYANTIYEDRYGSWPKIICIVLNIIFFTLNVTIGCLVDSPTTNQSEHRRIYLCYIYYAVAIDALIALLVGYFGYHFVYDNNYHSYRHWILLPRSIETFSFINWLIVACFFTRSIFVFLSSIPKVKDTVHTDISFNGDHPVSSIVMLLFFLITEWVPNSAMLYLLWKPNTKKSKKYYSSQLHGGDSDTKLSEGKAGYVLKLMALLPDLAQNSSQSLSSLFFASRKPQTDGPDSPHHDGGSSHHLAGSRRYKPLGTSLLEGEDESQRSSYSEQLITEDDLRDQGFHVRNQSIEDAVVRVFYNNPSESQRGSSVSATSDYGQHVVLTPEEVFDYSTEFYSQKLLPPAVTARPPSLLNPSQLSQQPVGRGGVVALQKSSPSQLHQPPLRSTDESPRHPQRQPSTSKNTVISALYLNSAPSVLNNKLPVPPPLPSQPQRNSADPSPTDPTKPGGAESTPVSGNKGSRRNSRNNSTAGNMPKNTSFTHLDPSLIFKTVDSPQEEFNRYDLNEKYADTIGPRDILKSKM